MEGVSAMTLTRKEILNRTPGPELDALIAIHVMGWTTSESWDGRYWVDADKCSRYEKKEFKPSQYINIAWEVLERMQDSGWSWDMKMNNLAKEVEVRIGRGQAVSKSVPEAIGKSALIANLDAIEWATDV